MKNKRKKFLNLLDPISGQIQGYVQNIAWSQNDVQDIFQIGLMNAYKKFDTFEMGTNFKSWIFRFITHAAYNQNRKHARISKYEVIEEAGIGKEKQVTEQLEVELSYQNLLDNPERYLKEMEPQIKEAVFNLTEKQRNIFLLRSLSELSYEEISDVLVIPKGSVMGELFRARKNLRKSLAQIVREKNLVRGGGEDDGV